MTQAVLFFEYLVIIVVKLRALFNEFFRSVPAPVLLLFVVINNGAFATCCKSITCKSEFSGITMKEQGITTLLFAQATHRILPATGRCFSAGIMRRDQPMVRQGRLLPAPEKKPFMQIPDLREHSSVVSPPRLRVSVVGFDHCHQGRIFCSAAASVFRPVHWQSGKLCNRFLANSCYNRERFCNSLEINRAEARFLGREQEISGEASGRNREHFQGRFFEIVQSSGNRNAGRRGMGC